MNICIRSALLSVLLGAAVHGCSLRPPCGITTQKTELTTVPGVLHITLVKNAPCPASGGIEPPPADFELEEAIVEVDTTTQDIRFPQNRGSFVAVSLGITGLEDSVAPDFNVKFQEGKSRIIVRKLAPPGEVVPMGEDGRIIYSAIPGFTPPPNPNPIVGSPMVKYESNVDISFYSGINDRLYIISRVDEEYTITSCTSSGECEVSEIPEGVSFSDIDMMRDLDNPTKVKVWDGPPKTGLFAPDPVGIVALPVMCCLCLDVRYYRFSGNSITGSLDLFNGVFVNRALDERNGTMYAVTTNRGLKIEMEVLQTDEAEEFMIEEKALYMAFDTTPTRRLR